VPINATVTAKTGPASQVTAGAFAGMTGMLILPDRKIVQLFTGGDTNSPPMKEFDMTGVTTFTISISGTTYTVVIS
jgi:hypothetical protein